MTQAIPPLCGPLGAFFSSEHAVQQAPAQVATAPTADLQEAIVSALGFYRLISDANRRWAEAIDAGGAEFSWAAAEQFAAAYRWWLDGARPLMEAIGAREKQGVKVDHAGPFREAFLEVSLLPLDMDRARASVAALEKGQGAPFEQAMDELQAHLQQ